MDQHQETPPAREKDGRYLVLIDGVFYDEFGEAYDIEETTHWTERPEPPAND